MSVHAYVDIWAKKKKKKKKIASKKKSIRKK
jgi:hypothetical protein